VNLGSSHAHPCKAFCAGFLVLNMRATSFLGHSSPSLLFPIPEPSITESPLRPRILNALPILPAASLPQDRFWDRRISSYTIYFSSRPHPLGSSQPYLLALPTVLVLDLDLSPLSLSAVYSQSSSSSSTKQALVDSKHFASSVLRPDRLPRRLSFGVRAGRAVPGIVYVCLCFCLPGFRPI
jgi:hypothetical protein